MGVVYAWKTIQRDTYPAVHSGDPCGLGLDRVSSTSSYTSESTDFVIMSMYYFCY